MLAFHKDAALDAFPFGVVEVRYGARETWREADFYALAERELAGLRTRWADYERKAAFAENPYYRFFKKFKKTYPVLLQFESVLLKGRPFPDYSPVMGVPFLLELTTHVLSGTHDVEKVRGAVELFMGTEKAPFPGMRGEEVHTYPGDFCGRDDEGIILSEIAGADARTCASPDSTHVFYPVFGTPETDRRVVEDAAARLLDYIRVLAPGAQPESLIL